MSGFLRWLRRFVRHADPIALIKIGIAIVDVARAKTPAERRRAVKKLIDAIGGLFSSG